MTICKRYYLNDPDECIEIVHEAGRFFIHYNVLTFFGARRAACTAGPFQTYEEAHATLKKHRPTIRMA